MTRTIDFPHLGIHLSSVGNHITVFGFDIAYYGMIIGAGILAGIFMAVYEAKRTGQKEEDYYDLSICAVIISIIGARAYYVIFHGICTKMTCLVFLTSDREDLQFTAV